MAKRMLIDATHPEETRVVVLNGNRLEEFDFESSTKRQVKGNIYLAKITRVEPSLQASFVEYGGNRHGFLAFSEIHSDYYRIPVGDRRHFSTDAPLTEATVPGADEPGVPIEQALPEPVAVSVSGPEGDEGDEAGDSEPSADDAAEQQGAASPPHVEADGEAGDNETLAWAGPSGFIAGSKAGEDALGVGAEPRIELASAEGALEWRTSEPDRYPASVEVEPVRNAMEPAGEPLSPEGEWIAAGPRTAPAETEPPSAAFSPHLMTADEAATEEHSASVPLSARPEFILAEEPVADTDEWAPASAADEAVLVGDDEPAEADREPASAEAGVGENGDAEAVETLGGDEFDDAERQRSRVHRHYKIQEVVKRRQIMLVQVTKEERGNKGAALTTYLSLAGRYCVLMPNTARGGGVSRKITSLTDRRRLKEILEELDIPEGMGVIVRTAGAERTKAEIKRDYEYLLRLWNEIRELTLRSTAPALIYEEGDLIKRSIRDLYTRDIDEVLVEGEEGYRTAKAFMKMLMPSHAKRVQPYRDSQIGLLHRFQVESQIDAIHSPIVQLRSGGYVVIDQTEALVAIDVNSGRATRERNIEETALRTNLEAAEEIARQLRLRDLAGLIVIDFIDMEEHRNQSAVERRLKEALKSDRARIQVGRISAFGLLEMSRQRLRSSLVEASTQPCPHCGGTGFIRSTESTALYVLRSIEEEGMRRRSAEVCVYVPTTVALYILNHKRDSLAQLESRYGVHVLVARDDALIPPAFRLERLRALEPGEIAAAAAPLTQAPDVEEDGADQDADEGVEAEDTERLEADEENERGRYRRRRRRRRYEDERPRAASPSSGNEAGEQSAAELASNPTPEPDGETGDDDESAQLRRRRGRRGGRRRGRREDGTGAAFELGRPAADTIEIVVSAAEDNNAFEFPESRAIAASGEEAVSQSGAASDMPVAADIETASLAALAGEAVTPHSGPVAGDIETASLPALAGEPAMPHPERAAADEPAAAETSGAMPLAVEPEPSAGEAEAPSLSISAEEVRGNGAGEPTESGWADAATDPTSTASPPAAAEPSQVVSEVTSKPTAPRRGWWQRLIQP
jgi:ribonuclease E